MIFDDYSLSRFVDTLVFVASVVHLYTSCGSTAARLDFSPYTTMLYIFSNSETDISSIFGIEWNEIQVISNSTALKLLIRTCN